MPRYVAACWHPSWEMPMALPCAKAISSWNSMPRMAASSPAISITAFRSTRATTPPFYFPKGASLRKPRAPLPIYRRIVTACAAPQRRRGGICGARSSPPPLPRRCNNTVPRPNPAAITCIVCWTGRISAWRRGGPRRMKSTGGVSSTSMPWPASAPNCRKCSMPRIQPSCGFTPMV